MTAQSWKEFWVSKGLQVMRPEDETTWYYRIGTGWYGLGWCSENTTEEQAINMAVDELIEKLFKAMGLE